MNIPFLCVFLAFVLNYLSKIPVAVAMSKTAKGYDNLTPRKQEAELTGWGQRAFGAHLNSFEVFPAFGISVILAHLTSANALISSTFSIIFLITRIIYIFLYITNKGTLRTTVWMIGALCIAGNFILALL